MNHQKVWFWTDILAYSSFVVFFWFFKYAVSPFNHLFRRSNFIGLPLHFGHKNYGTKQTLIYIYESKKNIRKINGIKLKMNKHFCWHLFKFSKRFSVKLRVFSALIDVSHIWMNHGKSIVCRCYQYLISC